MCLSMVSCRVCTQSRSPECADGEGVISTLPAAQFLPEGGFWRDPGDTRACGKEWGPPAFPF